MPRPPCRLSCPSWSCIHVERASSSTSTTGTTSSTSTRPSRASSASPRATLRAVQRPPRSRAASTCTVPAPSKVARTRASRSAAHKSRLGQPDSPQRERSEGPTQRRRRSHRPATGHGRTRQLGAGRTSSALDLAPICTNGGPADNSRTVGFRSGRRSFLGMVGTMTRYWRCHGEGLSKRGLTDQHNLDSMIRSVGADW